ncbi:MAG: homoserine kinase [Desulfonatronovibrionaceae bacterium]
MPGKQHLFKVNIMPHLQEPCVPVQGSNLILIGMPGSGKSTIGRLVSRATGRAWVDTDYLLEAWWGMPLQALRDSLGLQGFRQAEEKMILSLKFYMTVISTGGSAVYSPAAMERLQIMGRVVFLRAGLETITQRLADTSARGLASRSGQTVQDIYRERMPLYQQYAGLSVATDDRSPDLCAEQIVSWLKK